MWWRIRLAKLHLCWHLETRGVLGTLGFIFQKFCRKLGIAAGRPEGGDIETKPAGSEEVLNLQPGEWVEVKSEKDILATLDEKRTYKGLGWMCNMRKFCGKRYRVYKRLERMLLESNGQYRQIKNTVLLENVTCDGEEWHGCDRSCYHFWREVWLKRVESPRASVGQGDIEKSRV